MRCESLDARLSEAVDAPGDIDPRLRAHVAQCLRCQAEMARYRRLRRDLAHLQPMSTGSSDLVDDILAALDGSASDPHRSHRGRRAACTIAAAAGAAGAIVLANRVRVRRIAG